VRSTRCAIEAGTGSAQSSESIFHIVERRWAAPSICRPSALRAPYGKRNSGERRLSTALSSSSVPMISALSASPPSRDSWACVRLWLASAWPSASSCRLTSARRPSRGVPSGATLPRLLPTWKNTAGAPNWRRMAAISGV
jgi:hypothetical protein